MIARTSRAKHAPLPLLLLMLFLATLLAACGGSGGSDSTSTTPSHSKALHVLASPGQPNADFFNPFYSSNGGSDYGTQGFLYETLYFTNLYTGQTQPWLASSYSYSSDLTQLTFHLRSSVKWNDGQPFSSSDVLFTFNEMKQYPALDQNSLWPSILQDVSAPDGSTVVFKLKHPNTSALYRIGDQVFIVPQHSWQTINGDPSKFANDKNPVGTGPYVLASYNPQLITYKLNSNYWGTKPQVETILVPSIKDNTTAITDMIKGELDWMGSGWDPKLDPSYTGKDPAHNHTWFAASNTVMLYLNLQKYPFNLLPVRQAISAAINRDQLPQGVAEYAKVAHPTGVIIPTLNSWISPEYQDAKFTYSQSQAASYLQEAGFTKGSDGFYHDKNGKQLSLTLDVVNGWSDWDQDTAFIASDLKAVGINTTINTLASYTPYYTAISTGQYDAALSWTNSGPTPYFGYQGMLQSQNSAPSGKAIAGTNFERWDSTTAGSYATEIDSDIQKYEATTDQNAQKQAMYDIEKIMVTQLPAIPLTVNVYWDEYTTKNWQGWPDANNSYDVGAPYQAPDNENVVLHLTPAS